MRVIIDVEARDGSEIDEAKILRAFEHDAGELFFDMLEVQSWRVRQEEEQS